MSEPNLLLTRDHLAGLIIFSKMVRSGVKTSSIDISRRKYDLSSTSTPEGVGSQAWASCSNSLKEAWVRSICLAT